MINYIQFLRIRAGGGVKRFHTMPLVGEQTVASHTWGVLQLLTEISDIPLRPQFLAYALYHDVAEYDTGDAPSHLKRRMPQIKELLDEAEDKVIGELGIRYLITTYEQTLLKVADLMEMLLFVRDQELVGNRNLDVVWERVMLWLGKIDRIPDKARALLQFLHEDRLETFPSTDRYREGTPNA